MTKNKLAPRTVGVLCLFTFLWIFFSFSADYKRHVQALHVFKNYKSTDQQKQILWMGLIGVFSDINHWYWLAPF